MSAPVRHRLSFALATLVLFLTTTAGATIAAPPSHAATVAATAPGTPRALSLTPGFGAVTVRWSSPATSGGCAIQSYSVRVLTTTNALKTTKTVTGSARNTTVSGLTARAFYRVEVRARNCVRSSGPAALGVRTKANGAAPMGDATAKRFWLPGGLGGISNKMEVWRFDPVSHSKPTGRRTVYTKVGTVGWYISMDRGFVYSVTGPKTLRATFPQTTTLGPEVHELRIDSYDATSDILRFTYDRTYSYGLGGCRYSGTPTWICA